MELDQASLTSVAQNSIWGRSKQARQTMFKPQPATLVAAVFVTALAFDTATVPRLISTAKDIQSNQEIEGFVQDIYNENRHAFSSINVFRGGNLHFHGSVTVGFSVEALLGKHVFSRVYDKNTGETHNNFAYFRPSLFRIVLAALIGLGLFLGVGRIYPRHGSAD